MKTMLVAAMAAAVQGLPASAATECAECAANSTPALLASSHRWRRAPDAEQSRIRLSNDDIVGIVDQAKRVRLLANGDDQSLLSLTAERNFGRKRKRVELISAPRDRVARAMMGLRYDARASDDNIFGIALNGGVEKRRSVADLKQGKVSTIQSIGMRADWIHAEHWRLSAGYVIDHATSQRRGIRRSVQLATGASPSAQQMILAIDYSPSFALAAPLRVGIEAHSDRLSTADAAAMAMRGRTEQRLALKATLGF